MKNSKLLALLNKVEDQSHDSIVKIDDGLAKKLEFQGSQNMGCSSNTGCSNNRFCSGNDRCSGNANCENNEKCHQQ